MKKFSIVLLALLLAGGFAFAAEHATEIALDGEVSANFGLDFENEEYGFYHDNTADFDITWTADGSSVGEGDVYAEISFTGVEINIDQAAVVTADYDDLSAKIVGPDWEVLLESATGFSNASSPDMDQDGDTDSEDTIDYGFDNGTGLTLKYSGITLGVDYWYEATTPDLIYMLHGGYSTEVMDGLTVGADVAVVNRDNANTESGDDVLEVFGSLTTSYVMDMLTVDAAVDFGYGHVDPADPTAETFAFDAAASVTATPVEDIEAYVAAYYEVGYEELDLFAKATFTGIEDTSLSVWGYLNDSGAFDNASQGGSEEALEAWSVGADAEYTFDIFTPYANVEFNAESEYGVKVGTKAALIDNATVDVNYEMSDIGVANLGGSNKNMLNLSVTVSL